MKWLFADPGRIVGGRLQEPGPGVRPVFWPHDDSAAGDGFGDGAAGRSLLPAAAAGAGAGVTTGRFWASGGADAHPAVVPVTGHSAMAPTAYVSAMGASRPRLLSRRSTCSAAASPPGLTPNVLAPTAAVDGAGRILCCLAPRPPAPLADRPRTGGQQSLQCRRRGSLQLPRSRRTRARGRWLRRSRTRVCTTPSSTNVAATRHGRCRRRPHAQAG